MFKTLISILVLGSINAAYAVEESPQTGKDDVLAKDVALGKKLSEQVDKQYKPTKHQEYQDRLTRIGNEMAAIANRNSVKVLWGDSKLNRFEYHFKVLEGEDVNAFSLPGGYIYFFDGLMKNVESDDELAGVVSHEISHAAFRHLATMQREQSRMEVIQIPLILIGIISGGALGGSLLELGNLAGTAIGSGWSQKAEEAADFGGFQFMLKSKYNPTGMLTFMERLAYMEREHPTIDWGIYRTHPPTRQRAEVFIERMKTAHMPIKRSLVTQIFHTQVKPGKEGVYEAWFAGTKVYTFAGDQAKERADYAATRIDAFMDTLPELFDIKSLKDGSITGKGTLLWQVTEDDIKATKASISDTTTSAVKSLKISLYNLSFRVWSFE